MLGDPERCRVVLVTVPEETPVNELIQTAYSLEDEVGVALGPVVVNGVVSDLPGLGADPDEAARAAGVTLLDGEAELLGAAARFRRARMELQRTQLDRMAAELPLPQIRLPYLVTSQLDRDHLDLLAQRLLDHLSDGPIGRPPAGRHDRVAVRSLRRVAHRHVPRRRRSQLGGGVLRIRRRRQDHHRCGDRHAGRRVGAPGGGGHHRPRPPSGRRARARRADQHPDPDRRHRLGGWCGRDVGDDARHQGDLRRAGAAVLGRRPAGRAHPRQRLLPEHLGVAVGHAGVHGVGEALRTGRRGRLRPGGGRHPADAQRPRLHRCAAAVWPSSSATRCTGCSCRPPGAS